MLRKILRLILFSASLLSAVTARAILFQAPGAASEDFQRFSLERNQQTYTHWMLKKSVDSAPEAHSQVLDFSQQTLQERSTKHRILEWDRLRTSLQLNRTDREILTLLAEKLNLVGELCRYLLLEPDMASLLERPQRVETCKRLAIPVPKKLLSQLESDDVLVIDGKTLTKNQIPTQMVAGAYQWKILSNRYMDRALTGTAAAFADQKFSPQNWVAGNCQNYKLENADFSLMLQAQIYFNPDCVKPGIPKEKTFSNWAQEHKALLWGLGVLAVGVTAAQLKDRTLVITKP